MKEEHIITTKKGVSREYKYVLKIDVDLKVPEKWLEDWQISRFALFNILGIGVESIIVDKKSTRGFHAFIHIVSSKKLVPKDLNKLQWIGGDDIGRVLINSWRIKRGVPWNTGNKLFDHTIWSKQHKCNCSIHKKIIKRMKEGQQAMGVEE